MTKNNETTSIVQQHINTTFQGHGLSFYTFRGRPCAIAADIGRARGRGFD